MSKKELPSDRRGQEPVADTQPVGKGDPREPVSERAAQEVSYAPLGPSASSLHYKEIGGGPFYHNEARKECSPGQEGFDDKGLDTLGGRLFAFPQNDLDAMIKESKN